MAKISRTHHITKKGTVKKNPAPKKLYRFHWPAPYYKEQTKYYIDLRTVNEDNGYDAEEQAEIKLLKPGQTWQEATPFGDSHTITRIH